MVVRSINIYHGLLGTSVVNKAGWGTSCLGRADAAAGERPLYYGKQSVKILSAKCQVGVKAVERALNTVR